MPDYNTEFREFLKELHTYYARERNLRDIKGLTFSRVKDIAREVLGYGKNHLGLLSDILNNPDRYPFHLFGLELKGGVISARNLGVTEFAISYRTGDKKEALDFIIELNPG